MLVKMKIALLSDDVINKIAAGEVIENPASVVKELVDNAIDAKAQRIEIEIQAGGQQLIKVEDDGCGMDSSDLALCLLRHATSKITDIDDLDALETMGFRGEALAAIASVSKVDIRTSRSNLGHRLMAEGGRVSPMEPCARNPGTSIEVRSLFFNTPARRKFLKSPQANATQVMRAVQSMALSEPRIAFVLRSQGQVLLSVDASDWKTRIQAVLGSDLSEKGVWLEQKNLSGWLGDPVDARFTRLGQHFFVNRRPIFSPLISRAVREAYGTRLQEGSHPMIVLYLEHNPEEFDVNVHPQKKEVRFQDEGKLFCFVRDSIQRAFVPGNLPSFSDNISFEPAPFLKHRDPWDEPFQENAAQPVSVQGVLWDKEVEGRALAVVGSYLLAERGSDVLLVDLREALQQKVLKKGSLQTLMVPVRLTLTAEESLRMNELIARCAEVGMDVQVIGPRQLSCDAVPEWLDPAMAAVFFEAIQEDIGREMPLGETIRRLSQTAFRRPTIAEAEALWKSGLMREVKLLAADLEKLFLRRQ
ncbi:MAG: mutL [Parachlamydiales bacterium]|nr:mutL [Parachlamydiales bacterium]